MSKNYHIPIILVILITFTACSTRKNTFTNRAYHNLTSWFNALFNGQEAMDKELNQMKASYKDDYWEVLNFDGLAEFKNNTEAETIELSEPQQPEGGGFLGRIASGNILGSEQENSSRVGFEKAEEKALKTIKNHSMQIRGEEKNRLISRAYLLLGQARYYRGKSFQALDALDFVQKLPNDKHKNNAIYFSALAQIQAGNIFAAEDILKKLYENDDLKKSLKAKVAKKYAWLSYESNDLEGALEALDKSIEFSKRRDKARLFYIQGQLLTKLGKTDEARKKFERVYKLNPGFEMEARAQTSIALNFDPKVHDYNSFKSQLEKVSKIGTYAAYKSEFLYAMGQIEEKRDSTNLAVDYYKKALREKSVDNRFKAETYIALADIDFNRSDYVYAGAYYDSAVSIIPESKRKEEISKISESLKSLMEKYYLVQRNDSILNLTRMDKQQKVDYFEKHIEKLKKLDEAKRKEEEQTSTTFLTENKINTFSNSFGNEGKFYFYSNSAKSSGVTEFKRIWGSRQLKDNWRISSSGTSISDQKAQLTGNQDAANPRRYDVDFYLEKIPTDVEEIYKLKVERDTTELALGIEYFDKFKNEKLATKTLEHLVETPPYNNEVLVKAYYNLFRSNSIKNQAISEKYKNIILNKFPETIYAQFILNPRKDFSGSDNEEAREFYVNTYKLYEEEDYEQLKILSEQGIAQFPENIYTPKFAILYAYSIGNIEGKEAFIKELEQILVNYDGTKEAKFVEGLLAHLKGDKGDKAVKKEEKQEEPKIENLEKSKSERRINPSAPLNSLQPLQQTKPQEEIDIRLIESRSGK